MAHLLRVTRCATLAASAVGVSGPCLKQRSQPALRAARPPPVSGCLAPLLRV